MNVFDEIRSVCAQVAHEARFVEMDPSALEGLAPRLRAMGDRPDSGDPAQFRLEEDEATLSFVLCLDAINFGSGWFPELQKRNGLSGYLSLAGALREHFEEGGVLTAGALRAMTAADCAGILEQSSPTPAVWELMHLFARSWNDLGALLEDEFGGSCFALVDSAEHHSANLVECLVQMPLYQDRVSYRGRQVPFYKRAQITCADLAMAFDGRGPGRFDDLDQLTLFADNLVPHVLRMEGVLVYRPDLLIRIEAGELIEAGSEEEVEIRAVGLHAVEVLSQAMAGQPGALLPYQIDQCLWEYGQSKAIKSRPRHRTRCTFY
ncbi:MAG: queuosine salvage family protein [Myxococcota bacterium]|nr:queuosine salvage family protein [Myxococcota bacterium]